MLERYPIKLRLFYGLGLMLLPLLLVGGVSFSQINRMLQELEHSTTHATVHLEQTVLLQERLQDLSSYLMLQHYAPQPLDRVRLARQVESVKQAIAALRADDPQEVELEERSREVRDAWEVVLPLSGQSEIQLSRVEDGLKVLLDHVFRLRDFTVRNLNESLVRQAAVRSRIGELFVLALFFGGIMLVSVGLYLARSIQRPLAALEYGVKRLGAGDLTYRLPVMGRDELGKLTGVLNSMADKLETSYRELEALSTRDYLTGLCNVREFYRLFHEEKLRAERYHRPFSLLLMDLDHFKQVNDSLGHQAGDLLLQAFARRLEKLLRTSDHIARIGGDEFGVILPETEVEAASELAERIRLDIDASPLPLALSGQLDPVTVSVGLATFPEHANEVESLFAAADQALYRAKEGGRNRLSHA
ncbi:MAG: hypothetical protein C0616_15240 [Desulfuromonas sp.]|nr:MAG: hypothetical protein C0616_15240 [Desulfuromonas sp.]